MLPVYFIVTGLSVDVAAMSVTAWGELGLILAAAVTGKLLGAGLPAKSFGLSWRESTGVGVLMNTRGLTEIVVLSVGLQLGLITPTVFTMLVIMALVTTVMAAPVLGFLSRRDRRRFAPESVAVHPAGLEAKPSR
jgi:Kef-type K+ transport system membrane component KefB